MAKFRPTMHKNHISLPALPGSATGSLYVIPHYVSGFKGSRKRQKEGKGWDSIARGRRLEARRTSGISIIINDLHVILLHADLIYKICN